MYFPDYLKDCLLEMYFSENYDIKPEDFALITDSERKTRDEDVS